MSMLAMISLVGLLAYGVASAFYLGLFWGLGERAARLARGALIAAFLLHAADIAAHCMHSRSPASGVREALAFLAWLVVGTYLLSSLRYALQVVGSFVAPAALILLAATRLSPLPGGSAGGSGQTTAALSVLARVHISLAITGVALFTLAAALSAVYLLEERQLRRKRLGLLLRRGVPLSTLESLSHLCVNLGFPIFTLALVLGALSVGRATHGFRPEYAIAILTWLVFGGLLLARQTAGLRGRHAASLMVLGFGTSMVVLLIYVARRFLGA